MIYHQTSSQSSSSLREFAFANERHPEHWRVRKRLGSGLADPATPGRTGHHRAHRRIARSIRGSRCVKWALFSSLVRDTDREELTSTPPSVPSLLLRPHSLREFASANERHPEHWRVRRSLGSGPDDCGTVGHAGPNRATVGAP